MSAVLSGSSDKSPEEIQLEMQKAISATISAAVVDSSGTDSSGAAPASIDFTDTSFISNVIETTANEVVEEGVDIEALKENSTGLAACVGVIKTALADNDGGDVATQLLEMHKTAKAVKETVSAGADLTEDVTATIATTQSTLVFDNYEVPLYDPPQPEPEPELSLIHI